MAAPNADVDSDTFLFTSESVNEVRHPHHECSPPDRLQTTEVGWCVVHDPQTQGSTQLRCGLMYAESVQ